LVLVGHCFEAEQELPLGPWVTALRAAGVVDDPGVQTALGSASRPELARLFPELGKAAPVADDAGRLFEAFRRLLTHLASTGRLVREVRRSLSGRAAEQLGAHVWEASAGHALLAVEMARTVTPGEERALLPHGVEALFRERIERLTPRAAQVVGVAAVVGRSF